METIELKVDELEAGQYLGLLVMGTLQNFFPVHLVTKGETFPNKKEGGYVHKFSGRFDADVRIEIRAGSYPIYMIEEATGTPCQIFTLNPGKNGGKVGRFFFRSLTPDGVFTFLVKESPK